jgi:hypothetical protein
MFDLLSGRTTHTDAKRLEEVGNALRNLRQPVRACFPLFAKAWQPIAPEPISVSNCRVKIMEEYGNLSLVARPNVRIVKLSESLVRAGSDCAPFPLPGVLA